MSFARSEEEQDIGCACEGEKSKWVGGCLKNERVALVLVGQGKKGSVKRSDLRNGYEAKERSGDPVSSSSITRFFEGEIRITNNEAFPYILPQEKEFDQESPPINFRILLREHAG